MRFPQMRDDGVQVDSGYFFWSGTSTKVSGRGMAERSMAAVFAKAKIPDAHAHRFRHTLLIGRIISALRYSA